MGRFPKRSAPLYIFDKDTIIDYDWVATLEDQRKIVRKDGTTVEVFRIKKEWDNRKFHF